ncbi:hypothetical protein [Desulfovibrio piger]|uniref:hypothetical protein n=1 Tax=Desulfovibrio piger TaxID=901 RepID=UPI0026EB86FC|nr:hypothetical protein [Desulfovibrio piger]
MGLFDGGIGDIAGAVGSVVGGGLGLIGSANSQANAAAINKFNYEAQKEFAQNSIRWRVADAKAAGLHPLAALGAQASGYTPSAAIGDSPDFSFLQDVGQNIGRAIDAKRTNRERLEQERKQNLLFNEELKGRQLQNQETQTRIDSMKWDMAMQAARNAEQSVRTQQQVPAMPSLAPDGRTMPGQGDATSSSLFKVKPPELAISHPQTPAAEAGTHPEIRYFRTSDGGYSMARSEAYADSTDDDTAGMLSWELRNRVPAIFWDSSSSAPPNSYLPDGGAGAWGWSYNPLLQAYYPYRKGDWLSRIKARFYGK